MQTPQVPLNSEIMILKNKCKWSSLKDVSKLIIMKTDKYIKTGNKVIHYE